MFDTNHRMTYDPTPLSEGVILRREGERRDTTGEVVTNVPWICKEHSPDGFNFGYGGSGPADLALNICEHMVRMLGLPDQPRNPCFEGECSLLAWFLHQPFKSAFIAPMPVEGGTISLESIKAWLEQPEQQAHIAHARERAALEAEFSALAGEDDA